MNFYDLHIHSVFSGGESSLEELASMAKKLGYKGMCYTAYYKDRSQIKNLQEEIQKAKNEVGIEILLGLEARNIKELRFLANIRRDFDIFLARGGDLKLNREACETPEVDILTHPEFERQDSGLDNISMKFASKNKIAIEINLREILVSNRKTRAKILSNIMQNISLAKKYKTPLIICSGVISHWELRDPYCLVSLANQLGLELKEAKEAISEIPEAIIKKIKERRSKNWIQPGVKVIK